MPRVYATVSRSVSDMVVAYVWLRGRQTDVPSLREDDAEEEEEKQDNTADPSVRSIWRQLI